VRHGGAGGGGHLLLADEGPVHGAGGVVPAPHRHSLQHLRLHDVAAVLVDVVVGLAGLPETAVRRGGRESNTIFRVRLVRTTCRSIRQRILFLGFQKPLEHSEIRKGGGVSSHVVGRTYTIRRLSLKCI